MTRLSTVIAALAVANCNAFAPSIYGSARSMELHATPIATVRKQIDGLTKDNFSSTLSEIEPFLLNDAGSTIYAKSMKRISNKAKVLGLEVPEGFAKAAKATEKRRVKQDQFIQSKEADRLEAEAAAASASAEESAPVEA